MREPLDDAQRGSASVALLSAVVLAGLVLAVLSALGRASAQRSHMQGTANTAAIVSATAWHSPGETNPCDLAREVASRNGVQLESCARIERSFQVEISAGSGVGERHAQRATARAGPRE